MSALLPPSSANFTAIERTPGAPSCTPGFPAPWANRMVVGDRLAGEVGRTADARRRRRRAERPRADDSLGVDGTEARVRTRQQPHRLDDLTDDGVLRARCCHVCVSFPGDRCPPAPLPCSTRAESRSGRKPLSRGRHGAAVDTYSVPVMEAARGETRNATRSATSAGRRAVRWESRRASPSGPAARPRSRCRPSGQLGDEPHRRLRLDPAWRDPHDANALRAHLLRESLAVVRQRGLGRRVRDVASGNGNCRWIDVTWTITPSPWASIAGSRARSSRTAGSRF